MGYTKLIGNRLGRQEKAKGWEWSLWDWIKGKMINSYFFDIDGYRMVNSQQLIQ